ncbi:hypothetical protein GPZ88_00860 [Streptococcus ruminicola]|uniref:Uncharacterized protein n=1 Tax=Streptococcus ruminicola TaxID=2686210 RepID=A0A6G8HY37_9STRE|nr:hypothetical protein [Streptococcus ruminicola]QIM45691.1 hypothetical protein GPZ88_00860 [Streptococcus ruminicola]
MNVTIEDYLDGHVFSGYKGEWPLIILKKAGKRYNYDDVDIDDFYGDYVDNVSVDVDANEFGICLSVIIELED